MSKLQSGAENWEAAQQVARLAILLLKGRLDLADSYLEAANGLAAVGVLQDLDRQVADLAGAVRVLRMSEEALRA